MTQERKAVLYIITDKQNKAAIKTEVKVYNASATIADLKAAGYTKLFDAKKHILVKEEVTCVNPNKVITDDTLLSEEHSFAYRLYVTEK